MKGTQPIIEFVLFVLLTIHLVAPCDGEKFKDTDTVASLFEKGVEAYLEDGYPECVEKIEAALKKYRDLMKTIQNCRIKCKQESKDSEPLFPIDIEDLRFHEKNIKNTLCLMKCKSGKEGMITDGTVNGGLQKLFEERRPYEYLHLCYYMVKENQKAASAAFTFLVANPNNTAMSKTLKKYSELPDVNMHEVVNYEAQDYVYLYYYGADAYQNKNWDSAINNMEESVISYLHSEDLCRFQCEGPFDPGWHPDFVPSIANHFTFVLKCKRKCKHKLASLNGEIYDDLLPSHYNYLQYAYYKKGNLRAACESVANYLLFRPDDESMLSNLHYYQALPKVQGDFFTPSQEAIQYVQRDEYEKRILKYVEDEFKLNKPAPVKNKEESGSDNDILTGNVSE